MAAQVGRTVSKWVKFYIGDNAGTIREIAVDSINGVGLNYPEKDLTAFQDAIRVALPEQPDFNLTITGPFDSTAAVAASGTAAAPTLSGAHVVLAPLALPAAQGTPVSFGVCIGIRHFYETGEPAFGQVKTTTQGLVCTAYTVNPSDAKYEAKFVLFPGSAAPTWTNAIPT
jgi:hypothetical protein